MFSYFIAAIFGELCATMHHGFVGDVSIPKRTGDNSVT
tara:strand:- start:679 stop:792 length:114 start_codon:yes stop_codon:yes gene_type:complete